MIASGHRPFLVPSLGDFLDDFGGKGLEIPGLRLVMSPCSTTTSLSTQLAPAFFTSVAIE